MNRTRPQPKMGWLDISQPSLSKPPVTDNLMTMDLSHFSRWDPKQALEIYQTGYHLTCIEISKIQKMLQEKSGVVPGIKRWLGVES